MAVALGIRSAAVLGLLVASLLLALAALSEKKHFRASVVSRRLANELAKAPGNHSVASFSDPRVSEVASSSAKASVAMSPALPVVRADQNKCGLKGKVYDSPSGDIVNGNNASQCEWTWQVSLRRKNGNNSYHFCGGSLISTKWVLTAAHCVANVDECSTSSIKVVVGDHDKDSHSDKRELELSASRIIRYPGYAGASSGRDFALIELATEVNLNECVGTVCLPTAAEAVGGDTNCHTTGWGTLYSGGPLPSLLQEAQVQTLNNENCSASYGGGITSDMLCAQGTSERGITDSCQGDSGGPLVCDAGDGRYVLQGVTSWGRGCAEKEFPGVYSRVTSALDWIHATMAPSPPPPPISFGGSMWVVTDGPCAMDEEFCISSPGYPSDYGNSVSCTIAINSSSAVPIDVVEFTTEKEYDVMLVDCTPYSGDDGPDGILPLSTIYWRPDHSVVESGWKICPSNESWVMV
jgi:secreted trypsin-like serine protease